MLKRRCRMERRPCQCTVLTPTRGLAQLLKPLQRPLLLVGALISPFPEPFATVGDAAHDAPSSTSLPSEAPSYRTGLLFKTSTLLWQVRMQHIALDGLLSGSSSVWLGDH